METKFLFFVALNEGMLHNCLFDDIQLLLDALKDLIEQEAKDDKIPTLRELNKHFEEYDDYFQKLSNGTWFHIQELTEKNHIKNTEIE